MSQKVKTEQQMPFRIELYRAAAPQELERILGRACHAPIAAAMFEVASRHYADQRLVLYRGAEAIRARAPAAATKRPGREADHLRAGIGAVPPTSDAPTHKAPRPDRKARD